MYYLDFFVFLDFFEVFLVLIMGDIIGKVEFVMLFFNERLEQISVKFNVFYKVLDLFFIVLKKFYVYCGFKWKFENDDVMDVDQRLVVLDEEEVYSDLEVCNLEEDYYSDDEGEVDLFCYDIVVGEIGIFCIIEYEIWIWGYLYVLVEDVCKKCEEFQMGEFCDLYKLLMWFCVVFKFMLLMVQLQFEVVGMIDECIVVGLGFSLNEFVFVNLEFFKIVWLEFIFRLERFLKYDCVMVS